MKLIKLKDLERVVKNKAKKRWDKKWRIVIFDIPETMRIKRRKIRDLLNQLSFRKIQQSVWLSPHNLLGEVEELARKENLLKFLILVETKKISKFSQFKKIFLIKKND